MVDNQEKRFIDKLRHRITKTKIKHTFKDV